MRYWEFIILWRINIRGFYMLHYTTNFKHKQNENSQQDKAKWKDTNIHKCKNFQTFELNHGNWCPQI